MSLAINQQTAVLKVRDTGIGMGETTLTRLFEPFQPGLSNFRIVDEAGSA